jgi:hypothetical protein
MILALLAAVLGAALLWPRGEEPPPSPHCRAGPTLAGVYHSDRLEVRKRCAVVSGLVSRVQFEEYDGDVHIDLETADGRLVVEIVPQDRSVVPVPDTGQRVTVVGPLVDDLEHGWPEVHPAWWISSGRIIPAAPRELERVEALLRDDR